MSGTIARLDRWLARAVAWSDRTRLGNGLRLGTLLYLPAWGLFLDSVEGMSARARWWGGGAFVILLIVGAVLERHRNTAALFNLSLGLRRVNGSFAGVLEDLTRKLERRVGPRPVKLSEAESLQLCVSLIARIRTLAHIACGSTADEIRLRVTLAIPDPTGDPGDLRVWAYDESYDDRRYSRLKARWPGAPSAFRNRRVDTIDDLWTLPERPPGNCRFRSVVSFPVREHHPDHPPLAVVNIDAESAEFFTPERTDRLSTYVQPLVQTVGLVLISRKADAQFTFS